MVHTRVQRTAEWTRRYPTESVTLTAVRVSLGFRWPDDFYIGREVQREYARIIKVRQIGLAELRF